ncbi:class I SAM-dependent methyltransferase [Actinoplanes sp. M2I2]|uniref:class I SAM-dependent methyltransferase n=1 Tax=Actinoplanes sp. M2I2 TaxID=1734444 RepID=UPI002020E75C|nr:class I SAM-dependent methyltransferase [Actinoplanes sp. M2I2]
MSGVIGHYSAGDEDSRMAERRNAVEWERTAELLRRWLPAAPATVLDVGGGPGRQARHLLEHGYAVTLFDLVPRHVDQATARGVPAHVADARHLPAPDGSADAVLLLGPLYHLPAPGDRRRALGEAVRVLRRGGVVIAAALSRWGRVLVRAAAGELGDPARHAHTLASVRHGRVEDATTTWDEVAYLHDSRELATELETAGLHRVEVVGVEGPTGEWARRDPSLNAGTLELARLAEATIPDASIHLLARGAKP